MTRSYRDVVKSLAMRGVSGTAAYVFQRPLNLLLEQKNLADRNKRQAAFDSLHGTDTGGIVRLSSFAIDNPLWVHGVRYSTDEPASIRRRDRTHRHNQRQLRRLQFRRRRIWQRCGSSVRSGAGL